MRIDVSKGIEKGDYVWTEFGASTLRERPERLKDISLEDALACGYADITEQGKHSHDKELVRLVKACARESEDEAKHGPQGFFFPEIYLKPEWARRQREYYLAEAEKCDPFCKEKP